MSAPALIGITLGDANGIGPEIAFKAALRRPPRTRLILIGAEQTILREAAQQKIPTPPRWTPHDAPPRAALSYWDPSPKRRPAYRPGTVQRDAARAAHAWITAAVEAQLQGALQAMVTAPTCKEGFMKAGIDVPGHTELLAQLTGSRQVEMMLLCDDFRVVLATRHVPLRDVASQLTRARLRDTLRITNEALRWLNCSRHRIAVCGLNPHAGDGGAIGREEIDLIAPVIRQARKTMGADLIGPVPADTVFHHVQQGCYDAVIAMYHDQGLAAFKMVAFEKGVNLTLGLPIVRTSPDHGTAFDLAGQQRANPSSMIEAVRLAAQLALRPNPWRAR